MATGKRVRLRVLARDVSVATHAPDGTSIQNVFSCVVESIVSDGHPSQVLVRLVGGDTVCWHASPPGRRMHWRWH